MTCESCIRNGLAKTGFTCPLTGTKGMSPVDLLPNVSLRKADDAFVRDVMAKMDVGQAGGGGEEARCGSREKGQGQGRGERQ